MHCAASKFGAQLLVSIKPSFLAKAIISWTKGLMMAKPKNRLFALALTAALSRKDRCIDNKQVQEECEGCAGKHRTRITCTHASK